MKTLSAIPSGDPAAFAPAATIDVTRETCPMTFVRTRLALDRLGPGAILAVRLRGAEPYLGITTSSRALGHEIVAEEAAADGTTLLLVRKAGGPAAAT